MNNSNKNQGKNDFTCKMDLPVKSLKPICYQVHMRILFMLFCAPLMMSNSRERQQVLLSSELLSGLMMFKMG